MADVRKLGPGDEGQVSRAGHLFDKVPRAEATARFLRETNHHLLIAYEGHEPAGFVSGVEVTHPDKGTEMLIYELGVDEAFRRRGIATALLAALRELAIERGCYGMWVLHDDDNDAARATYANVTGADEERPVLLNWAFGD
ncbi:MAG: GNAT family N-acetyltransferase [Dehalococcoidia bacterium]